MNKINVFKSISLIFTLLLFLENSHAQCEHHNCDPFLSGMWYNIACVEETETAFVSVGWGLLGGDPTCTTPPGSWRIQISFAQSSQYIVESAASASGWGFTYEYDEPNKTINAWVSEQLYWLDSGIIEVIVTGMTSTECELLLTGANIQIVPSFLGGCPEAFGNNVANDALSAGLGVQPLALPVTLVSFDGEYDELKDVNTLSWITATETNSDYFIVQKLDGNNVFQPIGTVRSNGNTSSRSNYYFDDKDIKESKTYYYRLIEVDMDGTEDVLPVVAIKVERRNEVEFKLFPNPTSNEVNVLFDRNLHEDELHAEIFDVNGKIIKRQNVLNKSSIDLSDFNPGIYMVKLVGSSNTSLYQHKIIKI